MNTLNFQKIAFEAINAIKNRKDEDALRNATLSLPYLLRAHGLAAAVSFGEKSDEHTQSIASAFVGALHAVCTIEGADLKARIANLLTEKQTTYLLHSRLALKLADGMALAAPALWPAVATIKRNEHELPPQPAA